MSKGGNKWEDMNNRSWNKEEIKMEVASGQNNDGKYLNMVSWCKILKKKENKEKSKKGASVELC